MNLTLSFPRLDRTTPRTGPVAVHVKAVQSLLNAKAGWTLTEDGIYGAKTEAAVRTWQTFFGLHVDGIVGPRTMSSLMEIPVA